MLTGHIPVACLNLAQLLDESVEIILCGLEDTCAETIVQFVCPHTKPRTNAGGNTGKEANLDLDVQTGVLKC